MEAWAQTMPVSANIDRLKTLVSRHAWPDMLALFETEKSGGVLLDMAAELEQIGGQYLEERLWLEALLACYLGQWPAAHGSGIRFPESKLQDFYMRAYHLNEKLQAALENGAGESGF